VEPLASEAALVHDPLVDKAGIQEAFDEVFDQAVVFHGFTDYMRDYDVFIYVTAGPGTGIAPEHRRYRFKYCVRALVTSALSAQLWSRSLDERLVDHNQGVDRNGYVWGVKWQNLYPGMRLVEESADAQRWSRDLDLSFHEATIETNGHDISLVFADLMVDVVDTGCAPFVVPDSRSLSRS
jgi:hypothetical protein